MITIGLCKCCRDIIEFLYSRNKGAEESFFINNDLFRINNSGLALKILVELNYVVCENIVDKKIVNLGPNLDNNQNFEEKLIIDIVEKGLSSELNNLSKMILTHINKGELWSRTTDRNLHDLLLKYEFFEFDSKKNLKFFLKNYKSKFENLDCIKRIQGTVGEFFSYSYEKYRTGKNPKWKSREHETAPYDILSYKDTSSDEELFVEVKTARNNFFKISPNEAKIQLNSNSVIHLWDFSYENPILYILNELNPLLLPSNRLSEWTEAKIRFKLGSDNQLELGGNEKKGSLLTNYIKIDEFNFIDDFEDIIDEIKFINLTN